MSEPGTALGVSICGVENLEHALGYYRALVGLDVVDREPWSGKQFEDHWHLPAGSSARTALLGFGDSPVGRVLLLEFDASHRLRVRPHSERAFYGLFNLNFYCYDIPAAVVELKERGYNVWSEPHLRRLRPGRPAHRGPVRRTRLCDHQPGAARRGRRHRGW